MLQNVQNYHYPGSLHEAHSLRNREGRTYLIAGGTALALSNSKQPVELIDLNRLQLNQVGINVKEDLQTITIGSTVKIQELVESQELNDLTNGFLPKSLEKIGSYPIRNAATLGGSIVRPFPWSDVIPILLVLDAEIEYYNGATGCQPIDAIYNQSFRSTLQKAIITGIRIKLRVKETTRAEFFKFSRSEFDIATLNLACSISTKDEHIAKARLAVGARPSLASRVEEAERSLKDEKTCKISPKRIGQIARSAVEISGDHKASEEYRSVQVEKMTEDAITNIINQLHNGH